MLWQKRGQGRTERGSARGALPFMSAPRSSPRCLVRRVFTKTESTGCLALWAPGAQRYNGVADIQGSVCANRRKHAPLVFKPWVSREQPFLLFDAQAGGDAFQHASGGDLGKLFGLHFVKAAAVDAAFGNDFRGADSL